MGVTVLATVGWIVFDVLISLETAPTMLTWKWWCFLLGGFVLAALVPLGAWWERRQQNRERTQDRADTTADMMRIVQESQEQIRAEIQRIKTDIQAIGQKPESAQQKVDQITQRIEAWNPSPEQLIRYDQHQARIQQMMRTRQKNIFAVAGAWLDAQKGSSKDDPTSGNSN